MKRNANLAALLVWAWTALPAAAAEPVAGGDPTVRAVGLGLAAALAIAVSVLGAGYAVGRIGSAAMGAAAEKPELLTRSILFVALAEGLAVLGFAIAMMLLQKI
jgi:V/A-type H+/Na+-transporting ATPase subunit K